MIDLLLIIVGIVFLLAGLAGCIIPIIPGPPLSFIALLLLESTKLVDINNKTLWILFVITAAITIIDYLLPIWFVKKIGGSKRAIWGASIGLILGIALLPPIGIVIGPLIGAYIGEIAVSSNVKKAAKGSLATFAGFVLGTLLKIIVSVYMSWLFIKELWCAIP